MDKNKICEELYALPEKKVVKRHKKLIMPLIVLAVGAALLVVNYRLDGANYMNIKASLSFIGGVMTIAGLAIVLWRLFSHDGIPYYAPAKAYLRYEELYFERAKLREVMQLTDAVDVESLLKMESQTVPVVAVMIYHTEDNSFAACQAFEYVDLEYRPLCDLRIAAR
ncbi:MAG: hypothetical protein RR330_03405 [Alistipes sp.]